MNTEDIRNHIINLNPLVDPKTTVDNIKMGDSKKEINTVGVCWYPSTQTIKSAIKMNCDLLVVHEPTWWNHFDPPGGWRNISPGLERTQMLEKSGMVILRIHDSWDFLPNIGVRDSFAKFLKLDNFILEDNNKISAMYQIEPTTLKNFAKIIAEKIKPLGQDALQVMGNPQKIVKNIALSIGCATPQENMIKKGADVLIMSFDGASYWQTRERLASHNVGIITLEHGTSEMPGIKSLAQYIQNTWPDLNVIYLDNHIKPWHVS